MSNNKDGYFDTSNVDPRVIEQITRHMAGFNEGLARIMIGTLMQWKKRGLSNDTIIDIMCKSYRKNPQSTSVFKNEEEFIEYIKKRLSDMEMM